ncbi:MAG: SAF domain-containing protein [Candidatus Dormibacteraeota bacterium]|nr:SAF domain-containing protein [Candidatus Dormibacteraeota bacterium]
MAIQPNKPQNRVFLIVGIVLAAAAAAAVLFAVSGTVSKNNVPTANVVVAKSSIAAGTSITPDLLTTAPLAQGSFPADTFTDPGQAVGKIAPVTLSANIPLTASLFASATTGTPGTGVVSHLDITKGYVALAIPAGVTQNGIAGLVAEQMSVGFYIQPEDHIDILVDPGVPNKPGVRYAFQDVRVLRAGASSAAPAGTAAATVNSYIIELPRNQAEIMTALITGRTGTPNQITLKYVLRPQAEWGKRDGTNGFDKPNYESNVGTPLALGADSPVTADSLNALFQH